MTTFTPQAKTAPSYAKQALSSATSGEVFFGWLFWFTTPTGGSAFSKVAKATPAFTSVAKP